MKQFLKYPGSKYKSADWIIRQFPEHHSYLEPFFGSGAILFNKKRSDIETVNDIDGEVINLFRQIKEVPQAIEKEIYFLPYSREIYEAAFEGMPKNDLERAINFIIRSNMGHGYKTNGKKVGWKCDVQGREKAYAAQEWAALPGIIGEVAERLKGVQIENRPAVELIRKYNFDNVLIYADPPYLLSTRTGEQYRYEMTEQDHEELLKALKTHIGPVVISGYDSEMYNDVLQNWQKEIKTSYAMSGKKRTEVIWCNRPELCRQYTLFDNGDK